MSDLSPSPALEDVGQIKTPGFFEKLMDIKVGVISLPVYMVLWKVRISGEILLG